MREKTVNRNIHRNDVDIEINRKTLKQSNKHTKRIVKGKYGYSKWIDGGSQQRMEINKHEERIVFDGRRSRWQSKRVRSSHIPMNTSKIHLYME